MGKLLGAFLFLRARLSEPSTQASLAAVCSMVGYKLDPGHIQDAMNLGTILFGAIGFFAAETKPLTKV